MQIYTHDYTLPSQVATQLYIAQRYLRQGNTQTALVAIGCARELIDSYLAQDNMIEDDDAEGWVRLTDLETEDGDDGKVTQL